MSQSSSDYWAKLEVLAKNLSGLSRTQYRRLPAHERAEWRYKARNEIGDWPSKAHRHRWVYAISHPSWPGHVKIGECTNVRTRLAAYNVGCPYKLYRLELAEWFEHAQIVVHKIYGELTTHRTHGEWFAVDPSRALELVARFKDEPVDI